MYGGARMTVAGIDRKLARSAARVAALNVEMAEHVADHERLAELSKELSALHAEKESLETEWMEAAELLE